MKYEVDKNGKKRIVSSLVSYPKEDNARSKYPEVGNFNPQKYYLLQEICEIMDVGKTAARATMRDKGVLTCLFRRSSGTAYLGYSKRSFHHKITPSKMLDTVPEGCVLLADAINILGRPATTVQRMVKRGDLVGSSAMMRLNGTTPKKRTLITLDSIEAYFKARIRELQAEMETYERKERRA